ncbi:ORF6N domain-containing protein [Pedobacter miscanthi]|uniref:ORF6N domain-containing protein n=1 Tax=Pedobacter miscanthi TaxID=2259170 RepID=A0A366L525_9SPHI|nr:ORF6N domain-containing protein [Pedobacter miscanthi]RBQ08985.1 ORF6N domain-containing protein [Pedobacter miscanthi]
MENSIEDLITEEAVTGKIYHIRDQKVMLDSDLANLYQVETKQLKRQVKRNLLRFPMDFMFELNDDEQKILRYQFGTLGHGTYSKYGTMAFTEQGVAMLSSVLNSERAIMVNIEIIRIFTKIRHRLQESSTLRMDIERIKNRLSDHDKNLEIVFSYLDELMVSSENEKKPRTRIGFKPDIL